MTTVTSKKLSIGILTTFAIAVGLLGSQTPDAGNLNLADAPQLQLMPQLRLLPQTLSALKAIQKPSTSASIDDTRFSASDHPRHDAKNSASSIASHGTEVSNNIAPAPAFVPGLADAKQPADLLTVLAAYYVLNR